METGDLPVSNIWENTPDTAGDDVYVSIDKSEFSETNGYRFEQGK